ncbi:MAG TPA: hypothetical protein VNJ08_04540 [Bacteriovoracaceae bacterium]|nr:hypothetical protein [Bacteriovoracaceae bacterium]
MKKTIALLMTFISLTAFAGLGEEVFIRGKIGNDFDDKKVKVIDSFGQSYYLARKLFPADFKFKQGESFAIEVSEKEVEKIKIIKKK